MTREKVNLPWVSYFKNLLTNSHNNDEVVDYFLVYCESMQDKLNERIGKLWSDDSEPIKEEIK